MKFLLILCPLMTLACGQPSSKSTPTTSQQNGFQDVQICGVDIHLVDPGAVVYICGGSQYSTTSNAGYVPAENMVYNITQNGLPCSFTVAGGQLVPSK